MTPIYPNKTSVIRQWVSVALLCLTFFACSTQPTAQDPTAIPLDGSRLQDPGKVMIVDCLLPGQLRKLGQMTYMSPRRPIKTSALNCEIRGGEYVAFDRANYASALRIWLPQAKEGDANAQTYVGEVYEKGLGVQADYATAAQWYQKAVEQKFSRAQINLGYLYEKGLGVKQDLPKALNLYRLASGLGDDDDLQFTSTIKAQHQHEIKQAVFGLESQVSGLASQIASQQQEITALKQQLSESQQQLKQKQQDMDEAEQQLKTTQTKIDQLKQQNNPQNQSLLSQLATLLKTRKQQIIDKKLLIIKLKNTIQTQQTQIAQAGTNHETVATVTGPTIEILDPPMALTRSIPSAQLRALTNEQEIIGKISAPAGILKLSINDKPEMVGNGGLFRAIIPINAKETPVRVVAIDQQAQRTTLEFMLLATATQLANTPAELPIIATTIKDRETKFGQYYALVIGNNNYISLPKLSTAVNDAKAVEKVLRERYGFKTALLLNADRRQILTILNNFMQRLTKKDNLLIYYAGHGQLDRVNDRGHWLPVDAEANNTAEWISNIALTDMINSMQAKHVIVVADSCYSGSMSRTSLARLPNINSGALRERWLNVMAKVRSRTVLTSGGLEPVLDIGGNEDNHSVFTHSFLKALTQNKGILEGQMLYRQLARQVQQASMALGMQQTPQYAPIRHAGHESGDFFFIPTNTI